MIRDTDADWAGIAGEPYYGVFSHLEYFRDQLTPERLADFWRSGEDEIDGVLAALRGHFGDFQPGTAIDFGCGVGRLTRGIARHVQHVTGIDVAPGMLAEARANAPANATYDEILPDGLVDWINSIIVFQHIPPERGFDLLHNLLTRLSPGGALSLQFAVYKEKSALGLATGEVVLASWDGTTTRMLVSEPYGSGAMMMYDYDLTRIVAMLHFAGISECLMVHTNHGGAHGVLILGRKGLT